MIYTVVAKEQGDESGTTIHQDVVFEGAEFAHSSHLVQIMQNLDMYAFDLISITVKGE